MALNVTGLNGTLNGTLNQTIATATATATDTAQLFSTLKPLILFVLGIAIYAFFIFKFYRFLAARDILKLKWHKQYGWHEGFLKRTFKVFFYLIENIVVIPFLVFFWFIIMVGLLLLLSKNSPEQIMLISMAIVGAVRITAYYKEDLSRDLAKMIPFALLGVFIVDMTFSSFTSAWENAKLLVNHVDKLFFYLVFVAALELIMRIIRLIYLAVHPEKEKKENKEDEISVT